MGIRKNTIKIKTALISLSDKSNLRPLLNLLKKYKIKIISSGGTYKRIKSMGFKCLEVSKFTNSKELLDGRVKTLHPKIHSGILNVRQNKKHQKEMKINNYENIDLVVINGASPHKIRTFLFLDEIILLPASAAPAVPFDFF